VRYVALLDNETPSVVVARLKSEPMARESSRIRASSPLDIEDVVEASQTVGSAVAEGLLVARRTGFDLDANRLRALTAAGVKPSTVDVMVALSYPEHFDVAEETPRATRSGSDDWSGGGSMAGVNQTSCYSRINDDRYTYGGYGYDAYGRRYSRCGYNSFYSPFGYDTYGWGYGAGPVVVLQPYKGNRSEQVNGVMVKGKGYTRRGTSEGTAQPRTQPATTRTTTTTTGTRASGTTAAPAKGADTGSSAGASSKGSTGSSGSDTGRTAKPKGGGL
jgi:hypothetical protein